MSALVIEPRERRPNSRQRLERVHKQHGRHHDTEDLERVAGHVHHDGIHGDALCGGQRDLPRFFEEEVIGFPGVAAAGAGLLVAGLLGGRLAM